VSRKDVRKGSLFALKRQSIGYRQIKRLTRGAILIFRAGSRLAGEHHHKTIGFSDDSPGNLERGRSTRSLTARRAHDQ